MRVEVHSTSNKEDSSEISIFRQPVGRAVVKERRKVNLQVDEETRIKFTNIPESVEKVNISSEEDETFKVYQTEVISPPSYDLSLPISSQLTANYNKVISVQTITKEIYTGRLVVSENNITVLRSEKCELQVIQNDQILSFVVLNECDTFEEDKNEKKSGIALNQIITNVSSASLGDRHLQLSYVTDYIFWCAEYSVIIDEDGDQFFFNGKYIIQNKSGKTFENANITLLMGKNNFSISSSPANLSYELSDESPTTTFVSFSKTKVPSKRNNNKMKIKNYAQNEENDTLMKNSKKKNDSKFLQNGYCQKDLFFQLKKPITLLNGETVHINFAHGVIQPINQHYLLTFEAGKHHSKSGLLSKERDVDPTKTANTIAVLEFPNNSDNQLGFPLPSGNLFVYLRNNSTRRTPKDSNNNNNDNDHHLEVGDDDSMLSLAATSLISKSVVPTSEENQLVQIQLTQTSKTSYLSATKERISFTHNEQKKTITESFKIHVSNLTPDTPMIIVEDSITRWSNWTITESSIGDHHQNGCDKIRWAMPDLPPTGKTEFTYTVQYTY